VQRHTSIRHIYFNYKRNGQPEFKKMKRKGNPGEDGVVFGGVHHNRIVFLPVCSFSGSTHLGRRVSQGHKESIQ
jgi:hypothetical protein